MNTDCPIVVEDDPTATCTSCVNEFDVDDDPDYVDGLTYIWSEE